MEDKLWIIKIYILKMKLQSICLHLTEVDGRIQLNLLGVDYNHYRDENLAKNWYEYVKQTIENSEYTDLAGAMGILEVLYDGMIGKI